MENSSFIWRIGAHKHGSFDVSGMSKIGEKKDKRTSPSNKSKKNGKFIFMPQKSTNTPSVQLITPTRSRNSSESSKKPRHSFSILPNSKKTEDHQHKKKKPIKGILSKHPFESSKNQRKERPKVVENYKIGKLVGRGATGTVYIGMEKKNGFFFALKEINFDDYAVSTIGEKITEIQSEINIMKKLKHKNICSYYGAKKIGTKLHIFLEYIAGGSLEKVLKQFGKLSESVVSNYTTQILKGLKYLHKFEVIHRDIKCANILVGVDSRILLSDFGCSRDISELKRLNSLIGTPNFMAPEVIKQTGHGKKADIWSLGCTVLEMLTGAPPFSEVKTAVAVMYQIASSDKPPKYPDHLSEEAKDFLNFCFIRDPDLRPTAVQLLKHPFIRTDGTGVRPIIKKVKADDGTPRIVVDESDDEENDEESDSDGEKEKRKEIGEKMLKINEIKKKRSFKNIQKISSQAKIQLPIASTRSSCSSGDQDDDDDTESIVEEMDFFVALSLPKVDNVHMHNKPSEDISEDDDIPIEDDDELRIDPLLFLSDELFEDDIQEEIKSPPTEILNERKILHPQKTNTPKKLKIHKMNQNKLIKRTGSTSPIHEQDKYKLNNHRLVETKIFNSVEEPYSKIKPSPTHKVRNVNGLTQLDGGYDGIPNKPIVKEARRRRPTYSKQRSKGKLPLGGQLMRL